MATMGHPAGLLVTGLVYHFTVMRCPDAVPGNPAADLRAESRQSGSPGVARFSRGSAQTVFASASSAQAHWSPQDSSCRAHLQQDYLAPVLAAVHFCRG